MKKIIYLLLFMCAQTPFMNAQNQHRITIVNRSEKPINDYTAEIEVRTINKMSIPFGNYTGVVNGTVVPIEVVENIHSKQIAVIPIDKIEASETLHIDLKQGSADSYPKRTYAELSHKVNRPLVNPKNDSLFSWVKPNYMTLPGTFRDHSYYIKYEGPGWENDRVAFRFYLDNRNAIDVFGKKTSGIVLPTVGVNDYEAYHHMADWGMDNMKVGKALGIGTIAFWDGKQAVRVEKKDSMTCLIAADGKVRSQVKTIYHGWEAGGMKCNLTSLISIDAGSRASHMELLTDKPVANLATGINKIKGIDLITETDPRGEWTYIATFGKQSLNNDMQGLAIFFRTKQLKEITEDNLNHVVVLKPENSYVEYYFMPTWGLDVEPVATREAFMKCVEEQLHKLNSKLEVNHNITVNGLAENAKLGALVITDNDGVYYIEGLDDWDSQTYRKRVTVSGILKKIEWGTNNNEDGAIRQAMTGTQYILKNAIWKVVK